MTQKSVGQKYTHTCIHVQWNPANHPVNTTTMISGPNYFDPNVRNTRHFINLKILLIQPFRYNENYFMAQQCLHYTGLQCSL